MPTILINLRAAFSAAEAKPDSEDGQEEPDAARNALSAPYPDFDPLRGEPRFGELVSKIRLPVQAYCALSTAPDQKSAPH